MLQRLFQALSRRISTRTTPPKHNHLEVYDRFLDRKIVVVDVGCRWGFSDIWKELGSNVRSYGFDPDRAECARLQEKYIGQDVTLVARALGEAAGSRKLYATREPACSSLYQPEPALTSSIPELECATETGTTEIEVTTLDDWFSASEERSIDFIKLDVQGAELDVLKGGPTCLATVRALELEVEFNPIYRAQPLFADIDMFLRQQGFVLWRLSNMAHYTDAPGKYPAPAGDTFFYDSQPVTVAAMPGQLFWAHAHYVRPQSAAGGSDLDWKQSIRDAAIFEGLGFHDLSSRLLQSASLAGPPELREMLSAN